MSDFLIIDDNKKGNDNNVVNNTPAQKNDFMSKLNDALINIQKVKTKEKVVFYRLLATMVNAWMWVLKSVSILEKQEKNPVFKKILWRFCEELSSWRKLSYCLELYPASFWEAEVWIVRAWEKTWWLNQALIDLADQIEKVEKISWKIKWAMLYPLFILLVVVAVVVILMVAVVPKLLEIFGDPTTLPAATQLLIAISNMFVNYWMLMIIVLICLFIVFSIWKKTQKWRYIFDYFMLKIPVFWAINSKLVLSKFSRVFSSLLWSWVSVTESLNITSWAVWNEVYKQRILLLVRDVQQWIKIWESLDWDKLFPDMMVQMIQVWEQTAKLDKVIIKVADFYDEQVDNTVAVLNKMLEPFIIIILATVVWFIAIAIMQPIMNMSDMVAES